MTASHNRGSAEAPRTLSNNTHQTKMPTFNFLVGTFNTSTLYTLAFTVSPTSPPNLTVSYSSPCVGSHSWLHLSLDKKLLYATAWNEPPTVVAYRVYAPDRIELINQAPVSSRSGYVTASDKAVYSAGGASGDVFAVDASTGGFALTTSNCPAEPLQKLTFVEDLPQQDNGSVLDFGGLRHGAHSADLSPDGRILYVADIGRNAIFCFEVKEDGTLRLGEKHLSPRKDDGPRHVWPHPGGRVVYCLQEHSQMVDVFEVDVSGPRLRHVQGVRVIPREEDVKDFWADEVRTSFSDGDRPRWLYASTRGLDKGTKGYVSAWRLRQDGRIDGEGEQGGLASMWQTPTSGGFANAIQPGPTVDGVEFIALTESEECQVMVLAFDGKEIKDVARVRLDEGAGAATAVWL